jgi:cytoskeletal protein CcmA (bactofilin family)
MASGSVVGQSTVIRGNVNGEGSLDLLGRVEGDVTMSGDVVVGEQARVDGKVTGAQVSVSGTVVGDVRGTDSVIVDAGARVIGDLSAPRIGVGEGALVRGHVRTDGEPELETAKRPAAAVRRPLHQPLRAAPAVAVRPAVAPKPAGPPANDANAPVPAAKPPAPPEPAKADTPDEPEPEKKVEAEAKPEAPPPVVPALRHNARGRKKKKAHR